MCSISAVPTKSSNFEYTGSGDGHFRAQDGTQHFDSSCRWRASNQSFDRAPKHKFRKWSDVEFVTVAMVQQSISWKRRCFAELGSTTDSCIEDRR